MKRMLLILCAIAAPAGPVAAAKAARSMPVCTGTVKPSLFISPMGEPFRPKGDDGDPAGRWFAQADRDGDGQLTVAETMLDAERFFALLDKDGNGELLPDEVHAYEQDVAPEIRLYQRRPERNPAEKPEKRRRRPAAVADGAVGAGRFSWLNIPNPVASADDDINRAVSLKEFRAAAAVRFRNLDTGQAGVIRLAGLPKTPAQVAANAACLEKVKSDREKKR